MTRLSKALAYGVMFDIRKALLPVLIVVVLAAYIAFKIYAALSIEPHNIQQMRGVVITSGFITVSSANGATRVVASVQLPDGEIVQAGSSTSAPLEPGTSVVVNIFSAPFGKKSYLIVQ